MKFHHNASLFDLGSFADIIPWWYNGRIYEIKTWVFRILASLAIIIIDPSIDSFLLYSQLLLLGLCWWPWVARHFFVLVHLLLQYLRLHPSIIIHQIPSIHIHSYHFSVGQRREFGHEQQLFPSFCLFLNVLCGENSTQVLTTTVSLLTAKTSLAFRLLCTVAFQLRSTHTKVPLLAFTHKLSLTHSQYTTGFGYCSAAFDFFLHQDDDKTANETKETIRQTETGSGGMDIVPFFPCASPLPLATGCYQSGGREIQGNELSFSIKELLIASPRA